MLDVETTGQDTDAGLVARFALGDQAAAERIVRDQYAHVLRTLMLLSRDRSVAEDLTQDTFVKAKAKADSYAGTGTVKAWLTRLAFREYLQWRRRQAIVRFVRFAEPEGEPAMSPDEPDALVLYEALGRIAPDLREAFVLREVQGWSSREAADIAGVPEGTLSWRLHRAKSLLRTILTADDERNDARTTLPLL